MSKAWMSVNMRAKDRFTWCIWCGGWIEAGDYYTATRNLFKDEVFHWHTECLHAAERELNAGYSREFEPFEHSRGMTWGEMEQEADHE